MIAKRKILIVEDNDINREILAALLEEEFEVLEAVNGLEGLEQLGANYKDLAMVVLDIHMPVCDGKEFLRRRSQDERYAPVPVVVATASGSVEDELECLKLGANDFVVKPYNFEVMMNRINNLIQLRESASLVNQLMWDKVTNLNSKEFFYRSVEDAINASPDAKFDIVCSDIEGFKMLNDRYGTARCDMILRNLAGGMIDSLPGLIEGGRIGGDVFAFLLEHQEEDWTDRLYDIVGGLKPSNMNVKFGIISDIDHELSVSLTCDRALLALEQVKGPLGVGIGYYDEKLRERQHIEQTIIDSAEAALKNHEFRVYYQPKHNVHVDKTGGAEALVRWIHPELGFVNPGAFITLFEKNGFITKLDMYIWEEVCKEISRCQDLGLPSIPISVNASRLDFDVPNLAEQIAALADKYEIDRSLLHVELTETAYSDSPEVVIHALGELRDMGFSIELDDFGSGYSSLASLNTLPLDVMKLDMSVLQQAVKLDDYRIVTSAIQLAQLLGLKSVVEGVETAEEAAKVKELGCDLIQGYFYSKPLCQEEFEEYLLK